MKRCILRLKVDVLQKALKLGKFDYVYHRIWSHAPTVSLTLCGNELYDYNRRVI